MRTEHQIEIILDEGTPQERVIQATVDCDWSYQKNPGDREQAHYHGEDDAYYLEDWTLGEVSVNGQPVTPVPKDVYSAIEDQVSTLGPED